ncbi:MAG: hypothetical protein HZC41_03055 [Chloroflexi bacterium]|nr:hypothetical protein [Chloroflexota bacterium]
MTDKVVLSEQDWQIRHFIYQFFVEHGRPPAIQETGGHFSLDDEEARQVYHRLHQRHTIFLEPGTDRIRIANPLSAVPTSYRVVINNRTLWANCAWDSLGIPAMLNADAQIEARHPLSGEPVRYAVTAGELQADAGVVHFSLPARAWYDDLIHT